MATAQTRSVREKRKGISACMVPRMWGQKIVNIRRICRSICQETWGVLEEMQKSTCVCQATTYAFRGQSMRSSSSAQYTPLRSLNWTPTLSLHISMPFFLSKWRIQHCSQIYSHYSLKFPQSQSKEKHLSSTDWNKKNIYQIDTKKRRVKTPINSAQCNEDISSQWQQQHHTSNKPYKEPSTQSPLKTTSSLSQKNFKSLARKRLTWPLNKGGIFRTFIVSVRRRTWGTRARGSKRHL